MALRVPAPTSPRVLGGPSTHDIDVNGTKPLASVGRTDHALRLVWDREIVEMFVNALIAYRASGQPVPQGMVDNMKHWLEHVADDSS